jgi:hypothetical protein
MTDYDQVAAVLAAATRGQWLISEKRGKRDGYVRSWDAGKATTVADCRYKNGEADARFIALARNTYPELLAVARAAKAHTGSECRCGTLTHSSTCQLVITEDALRAALSDLEAKIREVMP